MLMHTKRLVYKWKFLQHGLSRYIYNRNLYVKKVKKRSLSIPHSPFQVVAGESWWEYSLSRQVASERPSNERNIGLSFSFNIENKPWIKNFNFGFNNG